MPEPAPVRSEVQVALDALDDLLTADGGLDAVGDEDLAAVDAWANNVQIAIARHRRWQRGRHV